MEDDGEGGEMTLCGTNSARYKASFVQKGYKNFDLAKQEPVYWIPLMATDYWRISLDSIFVGSNLALLNKTVSAILDTGTSLIAGPSSLIQSINAQIGAQTYVAGWESLDCSTLPNLPTIYFSIGGHNFSMAPDDYVIQVAVLITLIDLPHSISHFTEQC